MAQLTGLAVHEGEGTGDTVNGTGDTVNGTGDT